MSAIKESFTNQLIRIDEALIKGDLVSSDFKVVKKYGYEWTYLVVKNWFLSFFTQDPWKAYRINHVVKALAKNVAQNYVTEEGFNRLHKISAEFSRRASGNAKYEKAVHVFQKAIVEKGDIRENQSIIYPAMTTFANELCRTIPLGKNYVISPFALYAALCPFLSAIKLEQKEPYREKMGLLDFKEKEVHQTVAASLKELPFLVAQSMALQDGIKLDPALIGFFKNYGINMFKQREAGLALLNSFELSWKEKFTSPPVREKFTCFNGTEQTVLMHQQIGTFSLYDGGSFQMLEKPYASPEGRQLTQLFFLPHDRKDLPVVENLLTADNIKKYRDEAVEKEVLLKMPSPKLESEFSLVTLLHQMGLPFDLDPALAEGVDRVNLTLKTAIILDKEEAAAGSVAKCAHQFNLNHSYAFMIMDRDLPLFRGRVWNLE